ncbi:DUF2889 domain-containing protein [Verticiella sediminum]
MRSYVREDGLYDLEAELLDTKAYDFTRRQGVHKAGQPVHHMHVRVTFDTSFTIVDAVACYDAAPYGDQCMSIAPAYADLVGMNLLRGFRQRVKERFGRTAGCIHMSELAAVLPTAAVQTMAGQEGGEARRASETRPFHLDGCHALRVDGPVVAREYPRWYVTPQQPQAAGGATCGTELDEVIPSSSSDS